MYQSKMAVAIKVAGTTSHENKAPAAFCSQCGTSLQIV